MMNNISYIRKPRKIETEAYPLTICIAAMHNAGTAIIGASDRMITSGDTKFQPFQSKLWLFSNSIPIVVMLSGQIDIQTEILLKVGNDISNRIIAEPENKWNVEDVAELYSRYYINLRNKKSEREILSRFNLTMGDFIEKMKKMTPEFIQQRTLELQYYRMSDATLQVIIAGTDITGAHIYKITDGNISCCDGVGFAAIGSGSSHANYQFYLSGHTKNALGYKALLTTYIAKKRAEVAPGVGEETDMFTILASPQNFYQQIPVDILNKLDEFYKNECREIAKLDKQIESDLASWFLTLLSNYGKEEKTGE